MLLLPLLLAAAPVDRPRTYLLSIGNLPLARDEALESFSIDTWGVEFRAVCHIPYGWRIKAGNSATPDGVIGGEGSHGVTWFRQRNPRELRSLVLVRLGPVQHFVLKNEGGEVPATFAGHATISTDGGDADERDAPLTWRNVTLTPASRCP